jgi:hypothetical protein
MSWRSTLRSYLTPAVPRLLLVGLVCCFVIAVLTIGATSSAVFGTYNPTWDGTSDLRQQIENDPATEHQFLSDATTYEELDPTNAVVFIIAPDETYDRTEIVQIRQFVNRGGTIVVFENFGAAGNDLLSNIGAEARFDGRIIRDERHYFQAPQFPIATNVENNTRVAGIDQLTLNYATAINSSNATVLVRTSEFAYLAEEPDAQLRNNDTVAAMPVVTTESLGAGEVLAVGDPSITINTMIDEPDNTAFLRRLSRDHETVVFDLSKTEGIPPLMNLLLTIRNFPLAQGSIGLLGIAVIILSARVSSRSLSLRQCVPERVQRRFGSTGENLAPTMSTTEQAEYLRSTHPEWDEERIQRVITALKHDDTKDNGKK